MLENTLLHGMYIRQLYDKVLMKEGEKFGLTLLETNILLFLHNHEKFNTATELCRMRGIPKSNASNGIRMLERKGLIRIEINAENRKVHNLFLSDKAKEYIWPLVEAQEYFLEEIFMGFTQEDIMMCSEVLKKVAENARKAEEQFEALQEE